jgi:hypothetical protein
VGVLFGGKVKPLKRFAEDVAFMAKRFKRVDEELAVGQLSGVVFSVEDGGVLGICDGFVRLGKLKFHLNNFRTASDPS